MRSLDKAMAEAAPLQADAGQGGSIARSNASGGTYAPAGFGADDPASGAGGPATVKVWDLAIRLFHWSLVLSFAVAWLSADAVQSLHEWAGYAAGGLIGFRLLAGLLGTHYARFSQFVRSPAVTAAYLGDMARGREKRYVGHNPAGGMMVLALLVAMAALAFTGYLQTTDRFWGVEWVGEAHELLANGMLALIALHLGGVVLASLRHRENLVRAMVTGRKVAPHPGDIA